MKWQLLVLAIKFSLATSVPADYNDIEILGVACRPRDTCSSGGVRTFFTSNCQCDSWCHTFDDCCIDGPEPRSQNGVHKLDTISCFPFKPYQGVYVIGKCRNTWNGSDLIRQKCENEDDFQDPLISRPSTDTHTNVTYRNKYCAECNEADLTNLSSWDLKLTCSSLQNLDQLYHNITHSFIVENIERVNDSWGVHHWNDSLASSVFYPCEVSFDLPENLKSLVRFCRPDVISTCVDDWTREVVRRYCLQYMAVIYIDGQAYRNGHCALCNRVSLRNTICDMTGVLTRATPSMSFTLLLDVNQSDGDRVGETNRCSSGEKYDPFFKECRTLVCALPGHVFKNGGCVRQ